MKRRSAQGASSKQYLLSSTYIRGQIASAADSIRQSGIHPSPALLDSIAAYTELLLRWNRKLNLTAITDPAEIVSRNFAESFLAARWLSASDGVLWDVGSGAGFPGLALKLVLSRWRVHLVEPSTKKCAFLSEAARTLSFSDVHVERSSWQTADVAEHSVNTITSRAMGGHAELADWASRVLVSVGNLILWVGADEAENLSRLPGWTWERLPVPGSKERVILRGVVRR